MNYGAYKDLILTFPALFMFLLSLVPIAAKTINRNQEPHGIFSQFIPAIGLVGLIVWSVYLLAVSPWLEGFLLQYAFSSALIIDGVAMWCTVIVCGIALLTLLISKENKAISENLFSEFVFLLLNSSLGMLIVAWSNDLIVTFIGIELMSLCLYIMIAMSHEQSYSKEAAMKYFVLGSFASAIFLYGIALIFGSGQTTYIHELAQVAGTLVSTNRLFLIGIVMLVVGFGFKLSIFPFHAWAPDVYQGAPTPVTGFMATGVKIVTFAAFLRLVLTEPLVGERSQSLLIALQWLAVGTMLVGNVAAIVQQNFKRMLAYSSISHSGYLMIGLLVAGAGGDQVLGSAGVLFYAISYAVMTIGAFAVISLFERNEMTFVTIDDLRGLAKEHPYLALCLSIFMLSLAGIPPTVGFFGKFYLFSAAINKGFYWLAIWGVLNSAISVYYYLRPIVVMYMMEEGGVEPLDSRRTRIALTFAACMVILMGIASHPIYQSVILSVETLVR